VDNIYRSEIKYRVRTEEYPSLLNWIRMKSNFKKSFPSRRIFSLYYDDHRYSNAYSNISGESRRSKLRWRWYSSDPNETCSFSDAIKRVASSQGSLNLEEKSRLNSYSRKINLCQIKLDANIDFNQNLEILNKLTNSHGPNKFFLSRILNPSAFVSYKREYFFDSSNSIRMTIDTNLLGSDVTKNSLCQPIGRNHYIVEFKIPSCEDYSGVNFLKDFNFIRVRSSKYIFAHSNIKAYPY